MTGDLLDRPLRDQAASLRSGEIGCEELMRAALDRIARRDPAIGAFVHLDAQSSLAAAACAQKTLGAGEATGPLHGLPFGVKDIIDVAGQPGTCGSHAVDPAVADRDARAVARLRTAGAIPLGKLATYEFALTGPAWDQPHPPPRNPWKADHITGGSSSGSAAAVAGGLLRAALGTDTGGSVRSPASYCGAVGLKPTRDAVSRDGVFPLSETLDTIGPIAACVADAALLFDAMREESATPEASRLMGRDPAGLRLGFARDWIAEDPSADAALVPALDDAVGVLSGLGLGIELTALPDYDLFEATGSVILQHEALTVHAGRLGKRYSDYGRDARLNLLTGAALTAEDVDTARDMASRLTRRIDHVFAQVDILATATTLGTAPPFSAFEEGAVWTPMRTFPFNVTGHPAITLPCGWSGGLPLGLQLMAKHGDEARLCQVAHAFEQATDHAARHPFFADPVEIAD